MGARVRTPPRRPGGRARAGGKSRPPPGRRGADDLKEGEQAERAVADAARRTVARRALARHEGFAEISPDIGRLDEDAFADALRRDPDAALALLADLTGAVDERLRELARRLAGRVVVDLARRGAPSRRGIGRLATLPLTRAEGDLDVDASLDELARTGGAGVPDADALHVRTWRRPGTALCLLVDRSGSMGGERLATAAVAAAAVAGRAPRDYSVLAFAADVVVLKSQDVTRPPEQVVRDLLALRGFGVTDLAAAFRAAAGQLQRSRAARRLTLLLSDGRATVPGDVIGAARALDELVVVAPAADRDDAAELAGAAGARLATVTGPADIPDVFAALL